MDPDASAYYRRDKDGSSAEWYPHTHQQPTPSADGEPRRAAASCRRSGGSAEAEDIARRLKMESEDWYVYDGPGEGVRAAEKTVSPEVRRMQERATGNDMKRTLRFDDN